MTVPNITLNNGVEIPQLGFGVFQVEPGDETRRAVLTALEAGYRHLDTAQMYGNEESVGQAIRESGIPRDEVFVTTKLNNDGHGEQAAKKLDESLHRLGLDRVDCFLIHWPRPKQDAYVETWQALEEAYADGKARSIGVSNFTPHHLGRILAETRVVPVMNQVELHPGFPQDELRAYHADHEVATEAWSPLGQGPELMQNDVVTSMASRLGKDPGQVVLRWHLQLGNVVIPKSVTPSRIASNIDVFDFELSSDDMAVLSGMTSPARLGPDPDHFG